MFMGVRTAIHSRRREGIALLDVAMAIVVVSTTVLGVIQLYRVGMDQTREINEATYAMRAIANEVEHLRTLDVEALTARDGKAFHKIPEGMSGIPRVTSKVSCAPVEDAAGLYEVVATMTYPGRTGRTIEKSVTTWIAP